jgi:hypothetical protein
MITSEPGDTNETAFESAGMLVSNGSYNPNKKERSERLNREGNGEYNLI